MPSNLIFDARGEWSRDVLEELFEDLASLWTQRAVIERSADADVTALRRLDRRIAACADALALGGHYAWPVIQAGLDAVLDCSVGLSAAVVMGLQDDELGWSWVVQHFERADDSIRDGLRLGLMHAASRDARSRFAALTGSAHVGVSAAWIGGLDGQVPSRAALTQWMADRSSSVRSMAWRLAALCGASATGREALSSVLVSERLMAALEDPSTSVVDAAMEAGMVWMPEQMLDWARHRIQASQPNAGHAARLIARAGNGEDQSNLIAARASLGDATWCDLLARAGDRRSVERLVQLVLEESGLAAAFAARALGYVLGTDLQTAERYSIVSAGGDALDREFTDEIRAADAGRVESVWTSFKRGNPSWTRMRSGTDLTRLGPQEQWPDRIDMQARHDADFRARATGVAQSVPSESRSLSVPLIPVATTPRQRLTTR